MTTSPNPDDSVESVQQYSDWMSDAKRDIEQLADEVGREPHEVLDKMARIIETRKRMIDGLPPRDDEEITEREVWTEINILGPEVAMQRAAEREMEDRCKDD